MSHSLQARIEAAAAVTGHSVAAMLSHLADAVVAEVVEVEVGTNADASAICVSVGMAADAHRDTRLRNLANAISSSDALERSGRLRDSRVMRVGRGIGPKGRPTRGLAGVFSTVDHLEPREVCVDLAIVRGIGIPVGVADALAKLAKELGMTASTLRVTAYAGPPGANMQVELGAPASADLFDRLGDTGEAARFLRQFAPHGTALAWVGATPTGLLPAARIEYLQPDFDESIAIAGKFGAMDRAQAFFAALGARSMATVSVNLGACPLGAVWLSAAAD